MALSTREIDALVSVARAFVVKLQAGSAIADTGTDIPVMADFPGSHAIASTTALIAALINRYETEKEGVDSTRKQGSLPES